MTPAVLIVDDEISICNNLAAYLEDDGLQVHMSHTGEDALGKIEAGLPVQVCIVDLRLPGMDGNATILALHRVAPGIRFLIHSGSFGYTLPQELIDIGITPEQIFQKPADMTRMTRTVHRLCISP